MTNNEVMLALGDYVFTVTTAQYQTLQRRSAWRWAKMDRLDRKPAHQFLGPDADSITLEGVIYVKKSDDQHQIQKMRDLGDAGEPVQLVAGTARGGRDHGLWVILDLSEGQSYFLPNGVALKQSFTVTLAEYGEDHA